MYGVINFEKKILNKTNERSYEILKMKRQIEQKK